LINFDLWQHVRSDGALKLTVSRTEQRVDRSGNQTEFTVQDFERYGPISGTIMLQPNASELLPRVEKELATIRSINIGAAYIERMDQEERKLVVKKFRSLQALSQIFAEAEEVRSFLSPLNIASLNGWGRHQRSPASIHIKIDAEQERLLIGKTPETVTAIPIRFKPAFFDRLRPMPSVAKSVNDVD